MKADDGSAKDLAISMERSGWTGDMGCGVKQFLVAEWV